MVTEDSSWKSSQTDKSSQGVYKAIGVKGMDNFDMDDSNSKAGLKGNHNVSRLNDLDVHKEDQNNPPPHE